MYLMCGHGSWPDSLNRAKKYSIAIYWTISWPAASRDPVTDMPTTTQSLKNIGLKATVPRLTILELFQHTEQRHLTAEDVYRLLLNDTVDIGLATVYRVLTQFEQAGLLERHFFESGKAVFELNEGGHHDHLVCVECGAVEEFYDEEIERRQNRVAQDRGFVVKDHALYLYVECKRESCPNRHEDADGGDKGPATQR